MSWWRVSVELPTELAESLAWLLAETLEQPVEVQDAGTMTRPDAPTTARVVIGLSEAPPSDLDARIASALQSLGAPPVAIQTQRSEDESWRDGWRAFFVPTRLTGRAGVRPPWAPPDPTLQADVVIDPGMAFGTGTHATTRLAAAALDATLVDNPGARVLDVGTGSGILAILAALLGHDAVGVDTDPDALVNARENVARNAVAARVALRVGSADTEEERFPVVVANIIAPILIELAPHLADRCTSDLLLSGLLTGQEAAVRAAFPDWNAHTRSTDGEWVALRMRRAPR